MDWASLFRPSTDITSTEKTEKAENISVPSASSVDNIHYPDYIIGNPPFVGYAYQSKEQKEDLAAIMKGFGSNIDYVAGWYLKTAELMLGARSSTPAKHIKAALVSTNSITQGEQVAAIWKPLMEQYGLQIDFAYRTFRWDSEADIKAHVHCVIIGFSLGTRTSPSASENNAGGDDRVPSSSCGRDDRAPRIYLSDNQIITAKNINGYLMDAPNVFIENRKKPLCRVPEMIKGSQPTDGGNLILTEEERTDLLQKHPQIEPYIHPFVGSAEFINNKKRYCLWLVGANPQLLRSCSTVMQRIEQVRQMRLESPKAATQKWADYPTLFTENRQPDSDYLLVPRVSSEQRRYVPIGYMDKNSICSDANFVVPNATLYHFGVLTSNVHNAWMRAVCGRLEMRYRYSNTIVYNNFPWPSLHSPSKLEGAGGVCQNTPIQSPPPYPLPVGGAGECVKRIEQTAQAILDARAKYPDSSLADLYDEVTMPPELRKAHQDNNRAVMAAYGFTPKMTESECVAELFKMYQEMQKNGK